MLHILRCIRKYLLEGGVVAGLALLAAVPLQAAKTSDNEAAICDAASRYAARQTGVPLGVLRAISLTETGRRSDGRLQPWPWTVNMQGTGKWFETRAEAQDFAEQNFAKGARSFDIGCFQLNYRWHGGAFPSIEAMFEPRSNALYAARFLQNLFEETGSWSAAAGAYHSRTPKLAQTYRKRFDRIFAGLGNGPAPQPRVASQSPPSAQPKSPLNGALLASQSGGLTAPGSLVTLAVRADGWNILTPARGALF